MARGMMAFGIGLMAALALCACDPPSTEECNDRIEGIATAIDAAPADWRTCAVDADCSEAANTTKNCGYSCGGVPAAKAHVADLENFLRSDPTLAHNCKAYQSAGCDKTVPIPQCPAEVVKCLSGTCRFSEP